MWVTNFKGILLEIKYTWLRAFLYLQILAAKKPFCSVSFLCFW